MIDFVIMSLLTLDICDYIAKNYYNSFEIESDYECRLCNKPRKFKSYIVFNYKLFITYHGNKLCIVRCDNLFILGIIKFCDFDDLKSKLMNGDEISLTYTLKNCQCRNTFKYCNGILTEYCRYSGNIIGEYPLPESKLLEMINTLEKKSRDKIE